MKKVLLSTIILLSFSILKAQDANLDIKTITLDNGLKVVMCENHSEPVVYGSVLVHAGSKNDPEDATGMAHYFEHIMFKGTDKIGTTNWEAEKVYLDSIDMMYDKLHETSDKAERDAIQKKINELSIASTEYAIPNEVDVILTKMGGEGLNAGTSYDYTVYYNNFPSNQIGKWMDVYAERFRNPVFRLFQSELETVYEEKNMYDDNPASKYKDYVFKEAFGDHPYGRPIVGLTEHLKNPQTSRMREFYNTYYVANNMTLILVGDFNTEEVIPMVKEKFGIWKSGKLPEKKEYNIPKYDRKIVREVKMTPIKLGIIVYKGVEQGHEDMTALNLLSGIFSNGETGVADKDMLDGNYLAAMMEPLGLEDAGGIVLIYIPKLLFQSHEKAEEYIFASIDKIKKGEFSDELFEATKTEWLKYRKKTTEDIKSLSSLILGLETEGVTYEEFLAETEKIQNMTKEELVAIANKYLNDNYLDVRSSMGFPKKDKVGKPNWKPIEAKNTEAKSDFARMIEAEEVPEVKPQVIEFGKDVEITKANDCFTMISTKNPHNDIFNLNITYNYGELDDAEIERAINYLELQGSESKTYEEIQLEFSKLAAMMYLTSHESGTMLRIEGYEEDLDEILALCEEKIFSPSNDEKKKDLLVEAELMNKKNEKEDAATWGSAVYYYAMYGENSPFLSKMPVKDWAKRSGEELLDEVRNIFNYNGEITFVGNTDNQEVIGLLKKHNLIKDDAVKAEKKYRVEKKYSENQIFLAHSKKFRQSNIYMHVGGNTLDKQERATANVFNKYFGTDMYSIVFQEIREFRSLGYSAYGYYTYDALNRKPGRLYTYLGTQSDKTVEGIEALRGLITDMPERIEKFNASKDALILSRAADYISFRNIPGTVSNWLEQGYDHDPRVEITDMIRNVEYKDVYDFYKKNVADRPVVIMMSGNKKKIDTKALEKFGKVKELKYGEIFR